MGVLRSVWQDTKKQMDANFGKGFSDKCKTKLGDELDSIEKLIEKAGSEQKFLSKAAAELEATIAELLKSRRAANVALDTFDTYIANAKGLDPKIQKEATDHLKTITQKIQAKIKTDAWEVVKAAHIAASKVSGISAWN